MVSFDSPACQILVLPVLSFLLGPSRGMKSRGERHHQPLELLLLPLMEWARASEAGKKAQSCFFRMQPTYQSASFEEFMTTYWTWSLLIYPRTDSEMISLLVAARSSGAMCCLVICIFNPRKCLRMVNGVTRAGAFVTYIHRLRDGNEKRWSVMQHARIYQLCQKPACVALLLLSVLDLPSGRFWDEWHFKVGKCVKFVRKTWKMESVSTRDLLMTCVAQWRSD